MIALPCTDLESEIGHIKYNVKEVGYVLSLKEPQTTPQSLVEKNTSSDKAGAVTNSSAKPRTHAQGRACRMQSFHFLRHLFFLYEACAHSLQSYNYRVWHKITDSLLLANS